MAYEKRRSSEWGIEREERGFSALSISSRGSTVLYENTRIEGGPKEASYVDQGNGEGEAEL